MNKKEIMFVLSSIKYINIKKTLKSFNGKLNMVNLRYILRYVVNNDNNGNTIQIFYLAEVEENEALLLFKRRSLQKGYHLYL